MLADTRPAALAKGARQIGDRKIVDGIPMLIVGFLQDGRAIMEQDTSPRMTGYLVEGREPITPSELVSMGVDPDQAEALAHTHYVGVTWPAGTLPPDDPYFDDED